jgi:hypothetical protein
MPGQRAAAGHTPHITQDCWLTRHTHSCCRPGGSRTSRSVATGEPLRMMVPAEPSIASEWCGNVQHAPLPHIKHASSAGTVNPATVTCSPRLFDDDLEGLKIGEVVVLAGQPLERLTSQAGLFATRRVPAVAWIALDSCQPPTWSSSTACRSLPEHWQEAICVICIVVHTVDLQPCFQVWGIGSQLGYKHLCSSSAARCCPDMFSNSGPCTEVVLSHPFLLSGASNLCAKYLVMMIAKMSDAIESGSMMQSGVK